MDLDQQAKDREFNLREELEDKFLHEKIEMWKTDKEKKEKELDIIAAQNLRDPIIKELVDSLKETINRELDEEIKKCESERDSNLELARCKVVADNLQGVKAV